VLSAAFFFYFDIDSATNEIGQAKDKCFWQDKVGIKKNENYM
jgi:hypothetical protein